MFVTNGNFFKPVTAVQYKIRANLYFILNRSCCLNNSSNFFRKFTSFWVIPYEI